MSKVKICGLSREKDMEIVNRVLPDYIGFVFAKSRRQVNRDTALKLKAMLDPSIKAVGVFVNEPVRNIVSLCNSNIIDLIQLHGDEKEEDILALRELVSNPIIKAIRVTNGEDIKPAGEFTCDYLLFDTYQADQYGGSGKTFDWTILKEVKKPFFLAGGIHAGNLKRAQELCRPYCMDVSSGVETDGFKDEVKVREFVTMIRQPE